MRSRNPDTAELLAMLAVSASVESVVGELDWDEWFRRRAAHHSFRVARVPLEELDSWSIDPETGNIGHDSGRFFTIEGVAVSTDSGPVPRWSQPILNQPEVGVLGVLMKEFDGVLHCLVQAKMEPGNPGFLQLSPTVQATRSNYTRVHGGGGIPYLDHFTDPTSGMTLVDVLQSEQGAWFYRKQNRNMVVVTDEDVPVAEDFRWVSLGEIYRLLRVDRMVNMDVRSVLSCLPHTGTPDMDGDSFAGALNRSLRPDAPSARDLSGVLDWITDQRARPDFVVRTIPLAKVAGWRRAGGVIERPDGGHFRVIGASVTATNREVRSWSQPLIEPVGQGLVVLFVRRRHGVLHLLVHARSEAGGTCIAELAPTVQCDPGSHAGLAAMPPFLVEANDLRADQIRFDALLAEEGGRFFHATNRYVVAEAEPDWCEQPPPGYLWITLGQAGALLRHSHYVNVQARTLICALHSLQHVGRQAAVTAGGPA
jgi:oxidase EvaA